MIMVTNGLPIVKKIMTILLLKNMMNLPEMAVKKIIINRYNK